jgi:hypothetical protein
VLILPANFHFSAAGGSVTVKFDFNNIYFVFQPQSVIFDVSRILHFPLSDSVQGFVDMPENVKAKFDAVMNHPFWDFSVTQLEKDWLVGCVGRAADVGSYVVRDVQGAIAPQSYELLGSTYQSPGYTLDHLDDATVPYYPVFDSPWDPKQCSPSLGGCCVKYSTYLAGGTV